MMQVQPILVVDDEPEMRLALQEALTRSGFAVETAGSGPLAIDKLLRDEYRLVITDVRLPQMSGLDVLREVKRKSPETPVILITAYGAVDGAVEAMKEGAFDYLLKPFSTETLENVIKRALTAGGAIDRRPGRRRPVEILTQDPRMLELIEFVRGVAPSQATVLIQGESGTGKELFARFVHQCSPRRERPFVAINCAALPDELLESELFGHEKGAFTGAITRKLGKFELGDRGTILLDEISEMDLRLQAKLLRVLQEREVDRVGGTRAIPVDLRVISTTNTQLWPRVQEGKFREDLFYRLNVIPLTLPPLRERAGDIPLLCRHFLEQYEGGSKRLAEEALALLSRAPWRGNVRELENTIQRAVLLSKGEVIQPEDLSFLAGQGEASLPGPVVAVGVSVREMEEYLIYQTLKQVGGNRTHAARILGISLRTLRNKLNEYRAREQGAPGQNLPSGTPDEAEAGLNGGAPAHAHGIRTLHPGRT